MRKGMSFMNNNISVKQSGKKSLFPSYVLFRLKTEKTAVIFSVILTVLGAPLMAIILNNALWRTQPEGGYNSAAAAVEEILLILSVGALIMMFIMAAILPAVMTRYYRNKSAADMYYSMPLTHRALFFGDFASGLIVTVIPFAVCGGLSAVFLQLSASILHSKYQGFYEAVNASEQVQKYSPLVFLSALLGLLAAYALGYMISACCGRLAHSIIFTFIAMAVLPAAAIITVLFAYRDCEGLYIAPFIAGAMGVMPPLGLLIYPFAGVIYYNYGAVYSYRYLTAFDTGTDSAADKIFAVTNPLTAVLCLLFIGAFIAAAYFLSKKRKAECAEKPFAYNIIYHVLTMFLIFCAIGAGLLVSAGESVFAVLTAVTTAIIIVFAVYMVFERVHYKSFKKIGFSLLRFFCAAGVTVAAFALLGATRGFGAADYVPDPAEVEYVRVGGEIYNISQSGDNTTEPFEKLDSEEDIKRVCELHSRTLKTECGTWPTVVLDYKLKNGGTVQRFYGIGAQLQAEWYDFLTGTAAYEELLFGPFEDKDKFGEGGSYTSSFEFFYEGDDFINRKIYAEKIPEFISLVKSDYARHREDRGRNVGFVSCYIEGYRSEGRESYFSYDFKLYIGENMTDTISYLRDEKNSAKINSLITEDSHSLTVSVREEENQSDGAYLLITGKELENEDVKELISLMKIGDCRTVTGTSEKIEAYLDQYTSGGFSAVQRSYCFAKEDEERAIELVNKMIGNHK